MRSLKIVIEFWSFSLECSDELLVIAKSLLSAQEIDRANRFRFARHRRRFILRRAIRSIVLADRLETPLSDLRIDEGEHGRPFVRKAPNGFAFNASHAGECGVIVTGTVDLGVDIEDQRRQMDYMQFANRNFTGEESAEISRFSDSELAQVFFNCWTGKEAYVKALGMGLNKDLRSFCLRCAPDQSPGLEWDLASDATAAEWSLHRLSSGPYIASIAVRADTHNDALSINALSTETILQSKPIKAIGGIDWHES